MAGTPSRRSSPGTTGSQSTPDTRRRKSSRPSAERAPGSGTGAATLRSTQTRGTKAKGAAFGYRTLQLSRQGEVGLIVLNRPEVRNAFDDTLVGELTTALRDTDADPSVRAVVLLGAGKSFCAGADLEWMRRTAGYSVDENRADALALATMLRTLAGLSKPTIARVHGAVFGGGVGLVAACDIAIGALDAEFALSEGRLGLIPATISPYVVEAIGARASRRLFLTGERFTAAEAYRLGLLHDLAPPGELDGTIDALLGKMLEVGPAAQGLAKTLIREVAGRPVDDALAALTARRIADVRASPEGREGIAAFLERRRPSWAPSESPSD